MDITPKKTAPEPHLLLVKGIRETPNLRIKLFFSPRLFTQKYNTSIEVKVRKKEMFFNQ